MTLRLRKTCDLPLWRTNQCAPSLPKKTGFSLIEVTMAIALTSSMLVGSLVLIRDNMKISNRIDKHDYVLHYTIQKMEESCADVAQNWITGVETGSFSSSGQPDFIYSVTKTEETPAGIPSGKLMKIVVTSFWDEDQDDLQGANEISVTLQTKIANLTSYTQ